jgi:hypothetical protein
MRRDLIRALVKRIEVGPEEVRVLYRIGVAPFARAPRRGQAQDCRRRRRASRAADSGACATGQGAPPRPPSPCPPGLWTDRKAQNPGGLGGLAPRRLPTRNSGEPRSLPIRKGKGCPRYLDRTSAGLPDLLILSKAEAHPVEWPGREPQFVRLLSEHRTPWSPSPQPRHPGEAPPCLRRSSLRQQTAARRSGGRVS